MGLRGTCPCGMIDPVNPAPPAKRPLPWPTVAAEWSLYALLTALALHQTWLTWPDAFVDFGRELYNAWRIAEGEWPFRDIAHYSGPLSLGLNGLFFKLAGVSMHGLFALNFAVWLGIAWALWRILARIASTGARVAAMSVFILLFSFSRLTGNGNYNYLAPYAHELTHGLLLSLLAILAFGRAAERSTRAARPWVAAAGALLGLAMLTKPEIAIAAGLGIAGGLGARILRAAPAGRRRAWGDGAAAAAAAAGIVAGAVAILGRHMPLAVAAEGVVLPWRNLFNSDVVRLPYFQLFMGTDHLGASLRHWLPLAGLFAGAAGLACLMERVHPAKGAWIAAGTALAVAAGWIVLRVDSSECARPLPLFAGLATAIAGWRLRRRAGVADPADVLRWTFGVFATALLLKIFFFARIWHYGFVLAAPATVLVVAGALDGAPQALFARHDVRAAWRLLVAAVLVYFGQAEWRTSAGHVRTLTSALGTGGDRYRTDANAAFLEAFLQEARTNLPPEATLAVLPEGAMLNYLLRIRCPVPYTVLMPPEVMTFGEETILGAFRRTPPDFVLLLHKDTALFGHRYFGTDYGIRLMSWLRTEYQPVWALGPPPLQGEAGGLQLLRRSETKISPP